MKIALFYHSLISDWNHGNAHFLRGVATELVERGHVVTVFEPADAWSVQHLREDHGDAAIASFHAAYPRLVSRRYRPDLDLEEALEGVDLVIVHEWNLPELLRRIGEHRARHHTCRLLFHDTHHRAVTATEEMARYDLAHYDGVLAYGAVLRDIYLVEGWAERAWTWHEAADVRVFHPLPGVEKTRDLVWVGNWGDDERVAELQEFLFEPVHALGVDAEVFGVRYPEAALAALKASSIRYGGWVANFRVPELFASARVTVHVPRRPYARQLPGIPTIRPFEALACGIPLVSAPWEDSEGLFTAGRDYLVARDGAEMQRHLQAVLSDEALAARLAAHGRAAILARHTCAHRVDELLAIVRQLGAP